MPQLNLAPDLAEFLTAPTAIGAGSSLLSLTPGDDGKVVGRRYDGSVGTLTPPPDMPWSMVFNSSGSVTALVAGDIPANWADSDATALNVIIGNSATSIGSNAFYFCTSLTSVTIPDSVTTIGDLAFYNCSSMTGVTIPDSVTTIGNNAFDSCGLTSVVIGNSVTTIGSYAFFYCTSLTSVGIGNSVTTIGSYAFSYCTSLTSVVIPDSVTSIGSYAFGNCTNLTSVVIPDSVTSIGGYAFYECSSLTSIDCRTTLTVMNTGGVALSYITTIHARISDATWTAGPGQIIGGKSGITVIKDLT